MDKVSLHQLRLRPSGIAILPVSLFLCCTAFAQSPQIQRKRSPGFSLGTPVKADDRLGWSAKGLDVSWLQALLPAASRMLDPTLASSRGMLL